MACARGPAPAATPRLVQVAEQVTVRGGTDSYRLHVPPGRVAGLVVLLGAPDDAALPALLAERGIATAVPPVDRETLLLDAGTMRMLEAVALDALGRTGAPPGRVAIGGISLGGTGAVAYTEHCAIRRCDMAVRPRAVFAVDAPLDMVRFWEGAALQVRWDTTGTAAEARWILDRLARHLGGPPSEQRAVYAARSPFLYDDPNGGNARLLLDVPVRLYAEPDMEFWLDTMGLDYYQLNAFDAVAVGSRLRRLGHDDVEVILTRGRGHRPDGTRNPHSWSIVDEPDLARWLASRLEVS